MPSKDFRTIITDTGLITLPKIYRDYHQIEKGDKVEILFDGVLVVKPNGIKLSPEKKRALRKLLE